jgi:hypothetical protein
VSQTPSAASFLDSLRDAGAAEAVLDDCDWTLEEWSEALASSAPIESARTLALPALPWSAATLARFAVVFSSVESLTLRWHSVGDAPRPTLRDALAPWSNARLTTLVCDFAHTWGGDASAAATPAFASTLSVLRLRNLRHDECAKALRSLGPLAQLAELDAGVVTNTSAVFERVPSLRAFSCKVDAKLGLDLSFDSEAIESLSIAVHPRSAPSPLCLRGAIPSLRSLSLLHSKASALDLDALGALASSARAPLEAVNVDAADAWRIAAALGAAINGRHGQGPKQMTVRRTDVRDQSAPEAAVARAEDFSRLRALRAIGTAVEPTSYLALVDREAHLDELASDVALVEELDLNGDVHAFLLRDPRRFTAFARVRSLHFFDAHALTSEGLDALLRAMPALAEARFVNNHNAAMTHLGVRSAALVSLCLTHFHQLRTFELDAPALESLELDNCDDSSDGELDRLYAPGDGIIYGNFSEPVCASILDGAPDAKLPSLHTLNLWNNPYAVGPLLAVESMRVNIGCAQGHPRLERLILANVTHVRSLTLKSVPKLRSVVVSQYDDVGVGSTWLERADLSEVPAGCEVELCSITPSRAGLGAS